MLRSRTLVCLRQHKTVPRSHRQTPEADRLTLPFSHPTAPAMEYTRSLLTGNVDLEALPDEECKVISVYVCCTCSDTVVERNALAERVYPQLREYTRHQYGLEFQVVDPRFGVTTDWEDTSDSRKLCFDDLQRCQMLSAGPACLILLGQKYGDCAAPRSLTSNQFIRLREALSRHRNRETRDAGILDQWYQCDYNGDSPVYVLQSAEGVRRRLQPQTAVQKAIYGERGEASWSESRPAVCRLIQKATELCVQDATMDPAEADQLLLSDLAAEVRQGLAGPGHAAATCVAVCRDIVDLANYVPHPLAGRFMDLAPGTGGGEGAQPQWDQAKSQRLRHLRDELLPCHLPADNVLRLSVLWKHEEGVSRTLHQDYLDQVCQAVLGSLRRLIDRAVGAPARGSAVPRGLAPLPPVGEEVARHWRLAREYSRHVVGRHDVLDVLRSYVVSTDRRPLAVYGQAGVGKTTLVASAAAQAPCWVAADLVTVVRFIGTTASSRDLQQLLSSICCQLMTATHGPDTPSNGPSSAQGLAVPVGGYQDVKALFLRLLDAFSKERSLVLLLDGLQHLAPQYNAYSLDWLPRHLPENVKVIVTTQPGVHGILGVLQNDVIKQDNNMLHVAPLRPGDCMELVSGLLALEHRQLSAGQREFLEGEVCQQGACPLYVELVGHLAKGWASYDDLPQALPTDAAALVAAMLEEVEARRGRVLVSRALGYLTASGTGLSDCEMEDVLSLDEAALDEVLGRYPTPLRRLPPAAWLTLKHDLGHMLSTTLTDGVHCTFWRHRLFLVVARERYLAAESGRRQAAHSVLADYFLGHWAAREKPFKRPDPANNNVEEAMADRLVASQPLTFQAADGTVRYNRRQYCQVPRQLYLAGRLDQLNDRVLFNYDWLYNKARGLSVDHVAGDFLLHPGVEATLVERALRDAQPHIEGHMESLAAELTGRLLPYYNTHPHIRALLQQCDSSGLRHCALLPNFPYPHTPGSPLKFSFQLLESAGLPCLSGSDGRYLMAKDPRRPQVQLVDLATGQHVAEVATSIGDLYVTPSGEYLVVVDRETDKALKVHAARTGAFLGHLVPLNHVQIRAKDKYKLSQVSVSDSHICLTITTETSYLLVADLQTCTCLQVIGLDARSTICDVTPDGRFVFCSSGTTLLAYDLRTLEKVSHTALENRPKQIRFSSDSLRAYAVTGQDGNVSMLTLEEGCVNYVCKIILTEAFPGDIIHEVVLSSSEQLLLARGERHLAVYNTNLERVQCHFRRPDDLPEEFKLPKADYRAIDFSHATFSPDNKFVIATIFRNIYIWQVSNNHLLTSLQAPVGLIDVLLVPADRGQLVTRLAGSDVLHIWSLGDAIGHVGTLDKLTASVRGVKVTQDDKMALVTCESSDEVGVLDMRSGRLLDLLTHESPVKEFAVSCRGEYVFVALATAKPGLCNKIWHLPSRKVIYEFGSVPAYIVPLQKGDTAFTFLQGDHALRSPFQGARLALHEDTLTETLLDGPLRFVLSAPFVTSEDMYLVLMTADDYDETRALHVNPTIWALGLQANLSRATYSAQDLHDRLPLHRILNVAPHRTNPYTVMALYTSEPDDRGRGALDPPYHHCYGFFLLDVCSGVVCQVVEALLTPSTPIHQALFTSDLGLCLDHQSNVFDMGTGHFIKRLREAEAPPRRLLLGDRVVIYAEGAHVLALRLADGKCIARVRAHAEVTVVESCHDDQTLLIGCVDGSYTSFVLVDPDVAASRDILPRMASRQGPQSPGHTPTATRTWDRVDEAWGPPYSRPPSALALGPSDKDLLSKVPPVARGRPASDTALYLSARSTTCAVM